MKNLAKGLWELFRESKKVILIIFLIFLGIFILGNLFFFGISHFPKSCTVCHFMNPYFDQWKTSTHNQATCLKCHPYKIPFITVATIKYFTKTYNPRPHANVKDKNCLKKGCHDKRLIESKASLKGGIVFDHKKHWGITKKDKELRCTSCHYLIVQGGHFAIDNRICFLCHFKGTGRGRALTGCLSCHGTPKKEVEHEGFAFSHESYLKIGVKCEQCHLEVTAGNGEVPEEKCHYCHLPREERINEVDFLHNLHVSKKGYECLQCHYEIKHGQIKMIQALEVSCQKCHKRLHSRQKEIYMGSGGRSVNDVPSRMFAAQVTCDGCHISQTQVMESGVLAAGEKSLKAVRESCVICHGAGYDKMLDDWILIMKRQLQFVEPYLLKAERLVKKTKREDVDYERAVFLIQDARENFDLVRIGRAAHNVEYSVNLLKSSLEQVREALEILNRKPVKIALTNVLDKGNSYCLKICHTRIGIPPEIKIEKRNIDFPHSVHAEKLQIRCTECHSLDKHRIKIKTESASTETQAFLLEYKICDRCHGQGFTSILAQLGKDEQMKYPAKCTTCHEDVESITKQVFGLEFSHKNHSERKLSCRRCHSFFGKHGETNITKQSCASCHHQELLNNCQHCHLPQFNLYWGKIDTFGLKAVMDVMAAAEVSCSDCHDLKKKVQTIDSIKQFCVECHEESYGDILIEWKAELDKEIAEIEERITEVQNLVEEQKRGGKETGKAQKLLKEASEAYQKIKESNGIHNFECSLQIIGKIKEKIKEALNKLQSQA